MFPFGGVGVMLALIATAGVVSAAVAAGLSRRFGWPWSVLAGLLLWSVVVIGVLTLIPANGAPGIVSAEGRLTTCSWDIGGPAPDGFWIFPGGQRMLNAVVFVPAGVLLVLVAARWKWAWATVPLGLAVLAAYSMLIELTQLSRGPDRPRLRRHRHHRQRHRRRGRRAHRDRPAAARAALADAMTRR